MTAPDRMSGNVWKVFVNTGMCKNAIRNAGKEQDDIARVLNVSRECCKQSFERTLREWQYSGFQLD